MAAAKVRSRSRPAWRTVRRKLCRSFRFVLLYEAAVLLFLVCKEQGEGVTPAGDVRLLPSSDSSRDCSTAVDAWVEGLCTVVAMHVVYQVA